MPGSEARTVKASRANQDSNSRVQEMKREQCYQDDNTCESYPVCGDYICQSMESDYGDCPNDCGTSKGSNDLVTVAPCFVR